MQEKVCQVENSKKEKTEKVTRKKYRESQTGVTISQVSNYIKSPRASQYQHFVDSVHQPRCKDNSALQKFFLKYTIDEYQ